MGLLNKCRWKSCESLSDEGVEMQEQMWKKIIEAVHKRSAILTDIMKHLKSKHSAQSAQERVAEQEYWMERALKLLKEKKDLVQSRNRLLKEKEDLVQNRDRLLKEKEHLQGVIMELKEVHMRERQTLIEEHTKEMKELMEKMVKGIVQLASNKNDH